jgi:phenylalanyl-tRNA synthetase alpha chain
MSHTGQPPSSQPVNMRDAADAVRKLFAAEHSRVASNPAPRAVENLRLAFLGRKGRVQELLEGLRNVSKEERPEAGKIVNTLRQEVDSAVTALQEKAKAWILDQRLNIPQVDVSLPVEESAPHGALHPVSLMRRVLIREFRRLGFTIYDGPEIDFDFYNFTALNIPESHPARDMQDTFYVTPARAGAFDDARMLLRTQTSNIQIHAMLAEKPPLRVIAPGRVFRCDSDITHTPMFHQIEGFVVDKGITFANLKATIDTFLKAIYGRELKTRFRPSFFPFVEPGAEFDVQCTICSGKGCRVCKNTGWLEVGGCGMIHPKVFESVGYDSEEYSGFAFGFGIDRMAMLKYALPDLRQLFEGDYDFLGQFPLQS